MPKLKWTKRYPAQSIARRITFVIGLIMALLATPIWSDQSDADESLLVTSTVSANNATQAKVDSAYDLLVGFLAFDSGEFDIAAIHFFRAAQTNPEVQLAEYAMRAALLADDRKTALAAGKLWARLDPDDQMAIEFRIRAYSRLAAIEPAVDELDRLRQLSVGDGYHGYLPLLPLLFRDPSNLVSIKLMQGLVQRHQYDVYAHFAMADLATRFRLYELSISESRWALDIQPDFSPAAVQYASSLQLLNRSDEAVDHLFKFLRSYPDDLQVRAYYARLLAGLDQLVESFAQYLILTEYDNENEDYIYALAQMAYRLDDYDAAWRYYLELIVRGERGEEAKYMLGKIEEENSKIDTAISWYRSVGASQFFFESQVRAAELFVSKGQYNVALSAIAELRESNPVGHFADVLILEGTTLVIAGRADEAYELYTRHFDGPPRQHAALLHARALLSRDRGNREGFRDDLMAALDIDEEHHSSLLELGMAMVADERYDQATSYLGRALLLEPSDPSTLTGYGWLQLRLGKHVSAVSYLEKASRLDDDPLISAYLGEALWKAGSMDRARMTWHKGLVNAPGNKLLNTLIQGYETPP
ncbi:MAG: tetratricopeptide repeat protein [Gammaproteobacteria bacterium]|nr:tetratricopeptide repeat protein [Gammaproteobacteria bacterium]